MELHKPHLKTSHALSFIFVTIFIDVLGLGIIIPVLPKLLVHLGHISNSVASEYNGWLTFTYASMQFFFSPVVGNLSDRFGRRPVLLAALLGFGIDYTFMAFAPSIAWLFIGRFISGLTGASTATATAYIADISTGDKRSSNFGLVGAASGVGLIAGLATGAFLGAINIKFPFMAAALLALVNATYGFFVLPESLSKEHRRKFEWKHANPLIIIKVFKKYSSFSKLLTAFTLVYIGQKAIEVVLPYYIYQKFNWTMQSVGLLGLVIGLLILVIQGLVIRYTIPKLGTEKNIIGGMLFYAIGLSLMAFAAKGWQVYIFMVPYCLGGISGPALQGFITTKVGQKQQGELQGLLASLSGFSMVAGPLVLSYIFRYFTAENTLVYFPGAPYIAAAILMLISTWLAVKSFKRHKSRANRKRKTNVAI